MTVCIPTSDFIHSTALLDRTVGQHDWPFEPTCRHRTDGRTMHVVPMATGKTGALTFVVYSAGSMTHAPTSGIERLTTELERLRDGWCGPGSRAPSRGTLKDLDTLLDALGSGYEVPEIEVDDESGFLTLRWRSDDGRTGLSIILKGDGHALLIESKFGDEPTASSLVYPLAKADRIARHVSLNDELDEMLYA